MSIMKKLLAVILVGSAFTAMSQRNKVPTMSPLTTEGYYIGKKNDTVRGQVRTNPEDETEFYKQFHFMPKGKTKLAIFDPNKTKGYGYDDRHFVAVPYEGGEIFVERLAQGRLNLFKYRFNGKVDGYPGIETVYFAQDTRAEAAEAALKDIRKISTKFYKKDLKPYLKDQPMIWTDLDKFTFNEAEVVKAFNEFNGFYTVTAD
jgi:hypothetical protein